ncbi:P-loop containing nucleoside triphosphate hydrolase protein [Calocera cornea HHB12733]|uniref:p-loop containing nucleoside triphosphate hydrolase protein n=1 Tax=Calocera cornea HHB12733 TaxID=1353952 RepID=A0A165HVY1_9BASI|nr:P-loop containing nucleoside triphosphate hydrolase protein [Calocera cornea HHB12733]
MRPYQETCVQSCLDALAAGYTRIGVSSPTGSGKTTIFLSLISRLSPPEARPDATRALVIVSSVELVDQTAKAAAAMFPDLLVEVEQGRREATGTADLTIATYQSLNTSSRLEKFDASRMKAVIVDEAHHTAAPTYRHILSHFDPIVAADLASRQRREPEVKPVEDTVELSPAREEQQSSKVPIIGFSATFSRHDGLALGKVFQRIVYHRDFLEMIREQWLCDVRFTMVKANLNLRKVKVSSTTGDFKATSLAHVVNAQSINNLVVKTWLHRASDRKSTLVFCVDIQHVIDLTNTFRKKGIDARFLHSKMLSSERRGLVSDFRESKFPVLVNCSILVEGADMPNTDCVMLCRPTRSRNLFTQMIGRGMRLSPLTNKKDCRVIDFVDSIEGVHGVVGIPTLFGLDPDHIVDDASLEQMEEEVALEKEVEQEAAFKGPEPSSVTYIDYDDPFELEHDSSTGSPTIYQLSPFAWVACPQGVYVLECLWKGWITIAPRGNDFEGSFTPTLTQWHSGSLTEWHSGHKNPDRVSTPYGRKQSIFTAEDLPAALRAAETYAVKNVSKELPPLALLRSAKWRHEPASSLQISFIRKRLKNTIANLQRLNPYGETNADEWRNDPASSTQITLIRKRMKNTIADLQRLKPYGETNADLESHEDQFSNLTKGQAAHIITRLRHGAQAYYENKIASKPTIRVLKQRRKTELRASRGVVQVGPLDGQPVLRLCSEFVRGDEDGTMALESENTSWK